MKLRFVFGTLLLARAVAADPHPMAGGQHLVPGTNAQVAITREVLAIDIDFRSADVVAVLDLENRGPATKLPVGFPCDAVHVPEIPGLPCTTKIAVLIDGKEAAPRQQRTNKTEHHWIWPMQFAAGQRSKVEVRYRVPFLNPRYDVPIFGLGTFYYRLSTGSRWAGPIGELEMTVRTPFDAIAHIVPAGYTRSPGAIRWKLKDYWPTDDVAITTIGGAFDLRAYRATSLAEVIKKREAGEFSKQTLLETANQLEREGERFLSFYDPVIRSKLGLRSATKPEVEATVAESAQILRELAKRAQWK